MILIDLIEWQESSYSYFCDRVRRCRIAWYTSMGSTSDAKQRSGNADFFFRYLSDIIDNITNTWRITLEAIAKYQVVANFRDLLMGHGLLAQPSCVYDWPFGWPSFSYGVASKGFSCVVVSPLPCYSCTMSFSFFSVYASFFGVFPLFCVDF